MIGGRPSLPPTSALERLRRAREAAKPQERCDLCSMPVPPDHRHLYEVAKRQIVCACAGCALLFPDNAAMAYRAVPTGVRAVPSFEMSDAQWQDLMIPVDIAFFQDSTVAGKVVAFYPSPAGATESLLGLDAWRSLSDANPALATLAQDVEALIVYRVGGAREAYIVPIDRCYELVGRIRIAWRGLTGGTEVWRAVTAYFDALRASAVA